jgi:hypothetical protein
MKIKTPESFSLKALNEEYKANNDNEFEALYESSSSEKKGELTDRIGNIILFIILLPLIILLAPLGILCFILANNADKKREEDEKKRKADLKKVFEQNHKARKILIDSVKTVQNKIIKPHMKDYPYLKFTEITKFSTDDNGLAHLDVSDSNIVNCKFVVAYLDKEKVFKDVMHMSFEEYAKTFGYDLNVGSGDSVDNFVASHPCPDKLKAKVKAIFNHYKALKTTEKGGVTISFDACDLDDYLGVYCTPEDCYYDPEFVMYYKISDIKRVNELEGELAKRGIKAR